MFDYDDILICNIFINYKQNAYKVKWSFIYIKKQLF